MNVLYALIAPVPSDPVTGTGMDVYIALGVVVVFVLLLAATLVVVTIVVAVKLRQRKSSGECTQCTVLSNILTVCTFIRIMLF